MRFSIVAAGVLLASAAQAQAAEFLFEETFDDVAIGTYAVGEAIGGRFTVVQGSVRVVASGTDGINCYGSRGRCLALDGPDAAIEADIGQQNAGVVTLIYRASNSQRESEAQSYDWIPQVDGVITDASYGWTLSNSSLFQRVYAFTNLPEGHFKLRIVSHDTDGLGPIFDSLNFTLGTPALPEPATWAMMISGFGLVGGAMRRRRTGGRLSTSWIR